MSAAAARHRKQLLARKQAQLSQTETTSADDGISLRLQTLLDSDAISDEATAYEALQLAQSQVRKKVHAQDFAGATDLCYTSSLVLLQKERVAVASQLLFLLLDVLRETHTEETDTWLERLETLQQAHQAALQKLQTTASSSLSALEQNRLQRLQRDWLRKCLQWSTDLGTIRFGHCRLHALYAAHCWTLSLTTAAPSSEAAPVLTTLDSTGEDGENENTPVDMMCDAVTHMALAERPLDIVEWLATLPPPTAKETATGHTCPPATRDALLTRALLVLVAVENLRDANILIRTWIQKVVDPEDPVKKPNLQALTASYLNKEDGKAPSHVVFAGMLLRICEKDSKTGPLFTWLLRSFKRELEGLYKPQAVLSYTTKIGKVYFNIQPPPSMMSMMENMMSMMGGGGGGGGGMGGLGGIDPAMIQAAMAQAQGGRF